MATKTIGYDNSGVAGDFTTLAAWLTYLQGLGTLASPEVGQLMWGTSTPGTAFALGSVFSITGVTPSSSNTLTLTAKPGYSFRDNAGASTNALRPNAANGAMISTSGGFVNGISIGVPYVILQGIQVNCTGSSTNAVSVSGTFSGINIDSCLLQSVPGSTGSVLSLYDATNSAVNTLVINAGTTGYGVLCGSSILNDCTIVRPAANAAAVDGVHLNFGVPKLTGCAIFGYTNAASGAIDAASDYNATDQSSGPTNWGAHSLTSQTFSTCFVNSGSVLSSSDFRIPTGSALKDVGVTIGGVSVDIIGTTRPQGSSADIGAWEFGSTPTATQLTLSGPTSGLVNTASTNFTVTPNGTYTGTVTPATSGTGTFSPASLTFSGTSAPRTFTYTPTTTVGSPHNISITSSPSLTYVGSPIGYTVTSPSLAVGTLALQPSTDTQINFTVGVASGGTGPYTYKLYRYTAAGGSPPTGGTIVASGSSTTLADMTAVAGTAYFYICLVQDSASATVNSNEVGASTWLSPIKIGWFGDSNWDFSTDPALQTAVMDRLSAMRGKRQVTITNRAITGTSTATWAAGGATLTAAISAWVAAGVTDVWGTLGTNDSTGNVDAATYGSNLAATCAAIIAGGIQRVVLFDPPAAGFGTTPWTEAQRDLLRQYGLQMASIANGTTIVKSPAPVYTFTLNTPSIFQADGKHYSTGTGTDPIADILAKGYDAILYPSGGGLLVGAKMNGGIGD